MGSQNVNWDGIKDAGGTPPDGDYTLFIDEVKEEVSQNGNDMWVLTLKVMDDEYSGYEFRDHVVFTEKALWKLKNLYSALGNKTDGESDVSTADIEGAQVRADCFQDSYRNKKGQPRTKLKVARYLKEGEQAAPKAEPLAAPVTAVGSDESVPF